MESAEVLPFQGRMQRDASWGFSGPPSISRAVGSGGRQETGRLDRVRSLIWRLTLERRRDLPEDPQFAHLQNKEVRHFSLLKVITSITEILSEPKGIHFND